MPLLRELHGLCEKAPAICVKRRLQPLTKLFQNAIALAKRREELTPEAYDQQCNAIYQRFSVLATAPSTNAHVKRIQKRLHKYVDELFTFLEASPGSADNPGPLGNPVPPDNTPAERDIRSVAAGAFRRRSESHRLGRASFRPCQVGHPHLPKTKPQLSAVWTRGSSAPSRPEKLHPCRSPKTPAETLPAPTPSKTKPAQRHLTRQREISAYQLQEMNYRLIEAQALATDCHRCTTARQSRNRVGETTNPANRTNRAIPSRWAEINAAQRR